MQQNYINILFFSSPGNGSKIGRKIWI